MDDIELINFINLNFEEKKMILEWRNYPEIRKWMYNEREIKLEEHLKFIENLVKNDNKIYFLVKKDNENIGVIDFYNFSNGISSEFGLYANPQTKMPGVGRLLEEISIDYAFNTLKVNTLKLEVFSENIKVRNLHKKYKFLETSIKIINHKEVICMELKNENR